jgi:hypothetical protein
MFKRLLLAGMLATGCAAHAWAEPSCTVTEADLNLSPRLPEDFRAELVRTSEARCEIEKLRPPLIEIGIAVLKDIRELERRPQGSLSEWAEPLHRRHGPSSNSYAGFLAAVERSRNAAVPAMSADEREVRQGNVGRRLIGLAITGRIAKQEYDSLVRRLLGN